MKVEIDGREYAVDGALGPDRTGDLVVNGRRIGVEAAEAGRYVSLLVRGNAGRADRSFEILVDREADGVATVVVDGRAFRAVLTDRSRAPWRPARGRADEGNGPERLVAPMPGRVVRVLVKPGDRIAAGQPLVVIEAMKMENALRAGRSGVVADVRIAEGSLVEAQTVMVVLEPMGSADAR